MRILMLGWEFPPFISGGLGTACYGLTKALDRLGHKVLFVLPKSVDQRFTSHVQLMSPEADAPDAAPSLLPTPAPAHAGQPREAGSLPQVPAEAEALGVAHYRLKEFRNVEFVGIPSLIASPYGGSAVAGRAGEMAAALAGIGRKITPQERTALREAGIELPSDFDAEEAIRALDSPDGPSAP